MSSREMTDVLPSTFHAFGPFFYLFVQTFDIINEAGFGYQTNVLNDPEEKVSTAFNYLLTGGNRCVNEERVVPTG